MATKKSNSPAEYSSSDYQAEDDMRTLARAVEIKADAKRYKAAMKCAADKMEKMEEAFPELAKQEAGKAAAGGKKEA